MNEEVKSLLNRIYIWVISVGVISSFALLTISFLISTNIMSDILRIIGSIIAGAVVASIMQVKLLGDFHKQQISTALYPDIKRLESVFSSEVQKIAPRITESTIESIQNINERVSEAADFMLNGIGVLSGAKRAGIINIFPTRYSSTGEASLIGTIEKELISEKNSIRIMGISLGDYFLDRGVLHKTFVKIIEGNHDESSNECNSIQALIVHPKCDELRERARWEAGDEYFHEPAFFDSTTFIETDGAARISKRLFQKNQSKLNVRLYKQAPTSFVLLTSRFGFIESYNYSARGSNVPMIQIQAGSDLYKHYESHFTRVWDVSESIANYNPFSMNQKEVVK